MKQYYANGPVFIVNLIFSKIKNFRNFFVFVLFFVQAVVVAQTVGDYRSNVTAGNWTTLSSWQYYNGTTWVTPSGTSPQGYPGQFTGTGTVTIRDNQTITISSSTPNTFGALVIGEGISRVLIVGADIDVKTLNVTINASALVKFSGNNFIFFPENTSIKINSPGKFDDGGTCNNNVAVYIGTVKFAVCKGAGNSEFTFDQVNQGGGTILANPSSNTPICQNGTINLFGNISGTFGATTSNGSISGVNFSWSIKAPDNTISTFSALNPSFIASQSGTYIATINYSTYYGSNLYSGSKIISLVVNSKPSTPTITAGGPIAICSGGSVTLTSSVGSSYLWSTGATTQNVNATTAGSYTVQITNSSGCLSASSIATIVSVNALPNNVTNGFSATTICTGGSPQLTFDADDTTYSTPYSITYKNDTTLLQYTLSIPTAAPYSFTPADNPTSNTGYTLVSISNATCTRTNSFVNSGANLIVRPMPSASIGGTTSVCVGGATSNITFTNPQTVAISVTYTINGGSNQIVNISASSSTNVAVVTSVNGTFVYNLVSATYQTTPSCPNTISGSATVTVNPNLPASVSIIASPSGAICSGTSVTFSATPTNGGITPAYQWYNGATIISGATASTYTSTTLVNGDAIKVIMTSNATCATGSPATSNTVAMTVNPNLPASVSIVASPSGAICSGTSVTFTATPTNGGATPTYQWYNGATIITGATASTYTATTLVNGDAIKVVMTSNATCATSSPAGSNIVTMTVPAAAIWNGSGWTNGPPTSAQALIFNGTYNSIGDIVACSCQVNSGSVTINSGHTLKITNGLTVSGGTLTFENAASLVQINNSATNTGNINYNRMTPSIIDTDYVYWSSPVSGFTLGALSPNTLAGKMYSYDAFASPEDWKQESTGTVMAAGKGYIVRGPGYAPPLPPFPSPFSATFVGVPNNGTITIPIGGVNTSNLIGNPYPSALDADLFLSANSAVLEGTIYFWTHNTAIQLAANIINGSVGTGAYAYTSDDYASYNFTGGVGVGTAASTLGFSGSSIPSGKIGSGQSFFTTSIASGQVATFNNSMRLDKFGAKLDNAQFFKIAPKGITAEGIEKNRVWLNLTNSQGAFKQTLIGYVSGATNEFDSGYDGESYDGNEFIDFYSVYKDKNLVIQGRALPFVDTDEVPLGYSSTIAGDFTISIDQVDGLFTGKEIYLKDNMTNSIHNLNKSAYDYKTEIGTFNNRFTLRYTNANKTLAKEDFELAEYGVLISNTNKEVKVNSSVENIDKVLIYDMSGRQVYKNTTVNNKVLVIRNIQSEKQVLIVKVELQNGQSVTQKIVY
tara:strand:- start:1950 stop:5891 length:3942 start_codon:yes stop_codon:yes gene_type:complete